MTQINDLLSEYKSVAKKHFEIGPVDETEVDGPNRLARRLIDIAVEINKLGGIEEFKELLDLNEYKINHWAAYQIMDRMNPDATLKSKALGIIKRVSESGTIDAVGAEFWLKNRKDKDGA